MDFASRVFVVLAAVLSLAVSTGARADFIKNIDRRFPTNYCPIDNDTFDLSFTAETDRIKIRIQGNNFSGANWLENRLDNMVIVPESVFDANRVQTANFTACYLDPPGPADYEGYNFSAPGTTENFLDYFDFDAAAWDLTNRGWWDDVSFNASAPHDSATGLDRSGGALALGREEDGEVPVQTDFTVTGLTPGTRYVLTGWWSTQTLNTLTVTFITNPCKDDDSDGLTDCAGDCNDTDAKIRPGRAEVCDGRDNDCNGAVDDAAACVRVCTTASKIGNDLRLTNAQFDSSQAAIAWNGIDYGVLWHDSRNGNQEIWFTHVTPAGVEIGTEVSVSGACFDCTHPKLVWNGTEYAAVWSQNGEITFQRFDRSGNLVGSAVPLLDPAGSDADEPDLVWTGAEYGVVWSQFVGPQQIRFIRLDKTGGTLSTYLHVTDDFSFFGNEAPRIGWSGTKYGIAWRGNIDTRAQIRFELIDPRQGPVLPATQITTHTAGAYAPSVAWNGSEWGIAWQDHQSFTEVYFQRVNAAGAKVGSNVRITNASGVSNDPSLAWTGSEYGVVWSDSRGGNNALWFARISSSGTKIGSDLQLTTGAGQSQFPALAWGGGKYAAAWRDDRDAGEVELYFLRLGCNCVDGDLDGQSSCIDCDDAHATVVGGGAQICDGLNNDCNSTSWPLLTGNEADTDGDTFSICGGDCNDANAAIWATPGEARSLGAVNKSVWFWMAPAARGGTSNLYDTLRSPTPTNFTTSATCVETDGDNLATTDTTTPATGTVLFYLVRAENACPLGQGVLGRNSQGTPTPGKSCP